MRSSTLICWTPFQSTPSGGKATRGCAPQTGLAPVSIHAFRGEGDVGLPNFNIDDGVSIHAFRGEGDLVDEYLAVRHSVSIHAFRGEGDSSTNRPPPPGTCFNPRLPGGRRPVRAVGAFVIYDLFQSTPSGGKATSRATPAPTPTARFQSTPSGGKATRNASVASSIDGSFNPRLPGGRRPPATG